MLPYIDNILMLFILMEGFTGISFYHVTYLVVFICIFVFPKKQDAAIDLLLFLMTVNIFLKYFFSLYVLPEK